MVAYRAARPDDEAFLLDMLRLAFHWRDESARPDDWPDPDAPRRYVGGFGREGDAGVIAEADGEPAGAAWYRFQPASDPGYGRVEGMPEIALAVDPGHRGRGVARELLTRLIDEARRAGLQAVSLSVEPDNPSRRLYERLGFGRIGEVGGAWTMVRRLDAVVVAAGEGVRFGNVEFLGLSEHSPRLNVSVITMAPGRHGPEAHEHADEDDVFYILDGELVFAVDDREISAPAGTFVLVPPGVRHTFRNLRDEPARVLNVHAPAGFDRRLLDSG
jgi:mannose-6-phosphate isomerase-like protein (cupin superfamily)/ribosomal protein S18 acetylase RimI-like enzyme